MKILNFSIFCVVTLAFVGCMGIYKQYPQDLALLKEKGGSPKIQKKMFNKKPFYLKDIEALKKRKYPDEALLRYVKFVGTVYRLNTEDIDRLKKSKVSKEVIEYLLQTPEIALENQLSFERLRGMDQRSACPMYSPYGYPYSPYYPYPYY